MTEQKVPRPRKEYIKPSTNKRREALAFDLIVSHLWSELEDDEDATPYTTDTSRELMNNKERRQES